MIRHLRKSHLETRKDWTQVMFLGEAVCVQGSIAACMATLTTPCFYHSSRVFVQSILIWLLFSVIRAWLWVISQLPATLKFGRYQVLKSLFSVYTEANHEQSGSLLCCPYLIFPHNMNVYCTTYDSFVKVRAKYIWSSTMALLHINLWWTTFLKKAWRIVYLSNLSGVVINFMFSQLTPNRET